MFDVPLKEIKETILEGWDYSSIFPIDVSYTFQKGPVVVNGWPWQLLRQLETKVNGQASQPIVSIVMLEPNDSTRSFSDVLATGVGTQPLQWRLGRRAAPSFLISCWADQQLGGMDFSRKLGGQVYQAMWYYKNRLTTIRHLKLSHSREGFEDAAQLYRHDSIYTGDVFITLDV